jgi:5-methylcytosine-specific restriction protein A
MSCEVVGGWSWMAREFARGFYHSKSWKRTRDAYIRAHPLCERCLKHGVYTPGEIVHHKEHLTPQNIGDPKVSLSFDNLETLCRKCHAIEHPEIYGEGAVAEFRVCFDENGNVVRKGNI